MKFDTLKYISFPRFPLPASNLLFFPLHLHHHLSTFSACFLSPPFQPFTFARWVRRLTLTPHYVSALSFSVTLSLRCVRFVTSAAAARWKKTLAGQQARGFYQHSHTHSLFSLNVCPTQSRASASLSRRWCVRVCVCVW